MQDNKRSCDICGRQSKISFTRLVGGNASGVVLCASCAGERSPLLTGSSLDFSRLLSSAKNGSGPRRTPSYGCGVCGLTLADIVVDGKPGCAACYVRFASELERPITEVHRSTTHCGKTPKNVS